MKKLPAIVLSVMLIVLSLAVLPTASAAELKEEQTFGHIKEYDSFYNRYSKAIDYAAKEMYALNQSVVISDYKVPIDDIQKFMKTVINTHPELFYVSAMYSYSYYSTGQNDYVYSLIVHWGKVIYNENGQYTGQETTYTDDQVLSMRNEFYNRAQWYLDKVDDNMSDFEKALILHDELALNASYLLTGETYDLMVNGFGKCYGYSEAYAYLLAQVGVDSEIVESESMYHQWNKVKIDGEYYHVDVTWDDPTPDKPGLVGHVYFLLSDNEIESLDQPHYGGNSEIVSDDTRYDKMGYHKINTRLCYVGGDCYVVDNNAPSKSDTAKNLLVYRLADDSFETVQSFKYEYWSAGSGYVWSNMYMALDGQDGYLYLNTENTVYVYDTQNGTLTEFANNTYDKGFYGLRVMDDKVYAVLAESPNETGSLQYIGDCLVRETEPVVTLGDLNGDGIVNINDVTVLQRGLAEFEDLTEEQIAVADTNGDGRVNVKDVAKIQRVLADMETF